MARYQWDFVNNFSEKFGVFWQHFWIFQSLAFITPNTEIVFDQNQNKVFKISQIFLNKNKNTKKFTKKLKSEISEFSGKIRKKYKATKNNKKTVWKSIQKTQKISVKTALLLLRQ